MSLGNCVKVPVVYAFTIEHLDLWHRENVSLFLVLWLRCWLYFILRAIKIHVRQIEYKFLALNNLQITNGM